MMQQLYEIEEVIPKIRKNEKNYLCKKGKLPIIISAPHAVEQTRNGKIKKRDLLTGALAIFIANKIDCSYFVRNYNNNDDPNYPVGKTIKYVDNNYLNDLKTFIKENKIKLVIDLHGCNNKKEVDCSIWSDNYKDCNNKIINIFEKYLVENNLTVDRKGSEYFGGQVTRQCSLDTNAFQLEVKKEVRINKEKTEKFVKAMEEAIKVIGNIV